MAKVVIVSRTQMRNGVCVGGVNIDTFELIRLHNNRGANLPNDAPFKIGDVWEMIVNNPWHPRDYPHTEDRDTTPLSCLGHIEMQDISHFIMENTLRLNVANGSLSNVFDGMLQFERRKGFVGKEIVPGYSTQFWIADKPLFHKVSFEKDFYIYDNTYIRFVGFQDKIDVIPAGTIIRLSLANWWDGDGSGEERCYLQLSGWYL